MQPVILRRERGKFGRAREAREKEGGERMPWYAEGGGNLQGTDVHGWPKGKAGQEGGTLLMSGRFLEGGIHEEQRSRSFVTARARTGGRKIVSQSVLKAKLGLPRRVRGRGPLIPN